MFLIKEFEIMAINLLALEPHKIARDLSGYITYIYGEPKVLGL